MRGVLDAARTTRDRQSRVGCGHSSRQRTEKAGGSFLAPVPFYPRANLRHYRFLAEGIPDIAEELAARGVGFVLRTYPDHSLLKFCQEVRPAIVIGDENPMREPEQWRVKVASQLRLPLWTVDADVIVPSKLLLKEQFAARTIRPRLHALLPKFSGAENELKLTCPGYRRRACIRYH